MMKKKMMMKMRSFDNLSDYYFLILSLLFFCFCTAQQHDRYGCHSSRSAFSLSQSIPYFDSEETIKALRAYHSDTYKMVRRIQHFGHTRIGRIPKKVFKTCLKAYKSLNNNQRKGRK